MTFRGPADVEAFSALLAQVEAGLLRRVVFAVPGGVAWPLPLYELALQTASAVPGVELTFVTHEDDPHGRVRGLDDVFAAGDAVAFAVKQGGIAAQQADAAAETIAAAAGAPVEPQPFRPVLRGLLVTGEAPTFVRAELAGGTGDTSVAAAETLWWPPGKIAGRYLAPFLAERAETVLSPARGVGS
jgi:hypothetical protein